MKKVAVIGRENCVACGACAKACPKGVICIFKGCYAQVDGDRCVGCGLCAKTCPAGCIEIQERSAVK